MRAIVIVPVYIIFTGDDRSSATWHVTYLKLIIRRTARPIGRRLRKRHSFVALALLPPTVHPHLHTHCPFLPKIHQNGTSGAPSHPGLSLTKALNSCHDRRTGCPPDEYSQHSIDCLTHIWTLVCITYPAIYMSMNKYHRQRSSKRLRSEIGKYLLSPIPTLFIYLLRMMNVSRVWFMISPCAVTTGPPLHDL